MRTEIYDVSALTEDSLANSVLIEGAEKTMRDAAIDAVKKAASVIRTGGLVAFPTETVYGLGADAFNEEAVRRVYAVKGRPSDNPMIVHIARASDIFELALTFSPEIVRLIDSFWPGPLTLVLKKHIGLSDTVTGGLDTVAVRMPDNPAALELIRMANTPIAAPSANLSGSPSPTAGEHVIHDLSGRIDIILTGAPCRVGIESTVLDMSGDIPAILRPGIVTAEQLSAVIDREVVFDPALLVRPVGNTGNGGAGNGDERGGAVNGGTGNGNRRDGMGTAIDGDADAVAGTLYGGTPAPKAPGMKYRHYAPKAEMIVLEGRQENVRKELDRLKALNERIGRKVGVLLFDERTYREAAQNFFAELRDLDEGGADLIIAGALAGGSAGGDGVAFAVMNRMMKAAGYNIVKV